MTVTKTQTMTITKYIYTRRLSFVSHCTCQRLSNVLLVSLCCDVLTCCSRVSLPSNAVIFYRNSVGNNFGNGEFKTRSKKHVDWYLHIGWHDLLDTSFIKQAVLQEQDPQTIGEVLGFQHTGLAHCNTMTTRVCSAISYVISCAK